MKGFTRLDAFMLTNKQINGLIYCIYMLVFIVCYLYHGYLSWDYSVDDAFITLRYASHLAHHQGLVWNIGGPHVEGYSNFLYVLMGTMAIYFKLPAILVLKSFSAIAVLITCIGLYHLTKLWLPSLYSVLPGLVLLMHPGEIIWGVSGLETATYQALLVWASFYLMRALPTHPSKSLSYFSVSGLLLALASYTRPEGPMLFLCFALLLFWYCKSLKQQALWVFIIGFTLLYAPYFCWRLYYFGHLFPNSVYCKAMNAPSGVWELDLSYILLIFPLLFFIIFAFKQANDRRFIFLIAPSLCYLVVLYRADWIVGFLDRHFLAALALLLPLYIIGIHQLFSLKALTSPPPYQRLSIVIFSLLSGYLFLGQHYTAYEFHYTAQSTKEGNRLRRDVGEWLKSHVKSHEAVSLGDCGLIPYVYQGNVIDTYCLNNLEMTRKPIYYSYERLNDWLLHQGQPDYIILLALLTTKKDYYPPSDFGLLHDPVFHQSYKQIKRFIMGTSNGGYQYVIYKKIV